MSKIRSLLEAWFENFAHLIYHNRIKTLVIVTAFFAITASQIPKITFDLSTEGFLHDDDPTLVAYNEFRDQFGRDELLIIALHPPEVFENKFLNKVRLLHEEIEEKVPYIEDITSMVNARNTRGEGDSLIVEDLLENWPDTEKEMSELKNRVLSNDIYKNTLISEDGRFTTIVVKTQSHSSKGQDLDIMEGFEEEGSGKQGEKSPEKPERTLLTNEENGEFVSAVYEIVKRYEAEEFPVYLAGTPIITHFLKQYMVKDMRKFMALAIATIAILLFIMFRRISGVLLPLLIVVVTLLSTLGIMAFSGVAVKVPTQILPSFLLAVCVGASVHILAIFYHRMRQEPRKEDAIAYAMGHSGLAVVMTSVTTAAGLMSFLTAEVAPIADIGLFAGVGVLLGLVYTLVLLPALLALIPIRYKESRSDSSRSTLMDRFLAGIAGFSTRHAYGILAVSATIIIISIIMASRLGFSHAPLEWFPSTEFVRTNTEKIDHELRGSISIEVVLDTGRENGLYEPDFLNRLESVRLFLEPLEIDGIFVGKASSLTTILKETNQALNENRPEFYKIPEDRNLIAQEFLLFENSGSDDLEDFVDSQFSKARFTIKVPFKDAILYKNFDKTVSEYLGKNFGDTDITMTGIGTLLYKTITAAMSSMAKSYVIALIVITILMMILIGRVRIGLMSMIPNLAPILLTLGLMHAAGIRMDLFTMMVGSISIGLAVDDTIHFMHNFRRYYEASHDPVDAVYKTLDTTGRAMLVTTIVLASGFFIFTFASMRNLFSFGLLTAFAILMALVADYFIAPALMVVVHRKKP